MCQYSAVDGIANDWHLTHLVSRAVGGAGLVIGEAAAVTPDGRISPADLGIWSDAHGAALQPIVAAITQAGSVPGVQLAHAGRKGGTQIPWDGRAAVREGGWPVLAPSAVRFSRHSAETCAMTLEQIPQVTAAFAAAARRSIDIGFRFIELHFAHGYLVHEFLSPLSNLRDDDYGGDFAGRTRLALEIVSAVRASIPESVPLAVRLSCVDWTSGGWSLEGSIRLSRMLAAAGVDLIDCSSGSVVPGDAPPDGPAVQRRFAAEIRTEAAIATAAVGGITEPAEANGIIGNGGADMVFLARAMLHDPYWALHAAQALGGDCAWPVQYRRAVGR